MEIWWALKDIIILVDVEHIKYFQKNVFNIIMRRKVNIQLGTFRKAHKTPLMGYLI